MLNACADMNIVTDDDDIETAQEKNEQILSTYQILILTLEEQLIELDHDLPSFFEYINQQVKTETAQGTPRIINISVEPVSGNKPLSLPKTVESYQQLPMVHPRWSEDRLIAKNGKLKKKLADQPNFLLIRDCENQLVQARRQLAVLCRSMRDDRIFFKNRFRKLRKERNVAKKHLLR